MGLKNRVGALVTPVSVGGGPDHAPGDPFRFRTTRLPRILLAEDEDMLLYAWARYLKRRGLEIWMAQSGRDAVDILTRIDGEFDAIVCDLHMPDGGGLELYHFVEAEFPSLQHRIVFVTGDMFSSGESEFLRMTGNPVFKKPFMLEEIAVVARDWAARRCTRTRNGP